MLINTGPAKIPWRVAVPASPDGNCLRKAVTESPKLDRKVRGMAVPYNRLNMLVPFGVDRSFRSISSIVNETYRIKGQYRLRQHWHSCISAGSDGH